MYVVITKAVTFSTLANTLSRLSPATFFRSATVHCPLLKSSAKSSGYMETSSKPLGVLKVNRILEALADSLLDFGAPKD